MRVGDILHKSAERASSHDNFDNDSTMNIIPHIIVSIGIKSSGHSMRRRSVRNQIREMPVNQNININDAISRVKPFVPHYSKYAKMQTC